jgi:hypothetical protein
VLELRNAFSKVLIGALAGTLSYVLLLWLHGPWEEVLAAALIGSVVGIADRSPSRIFVGAAACTAGWVLASVVFSTWIELGIGAWLGAGAFLGAAFGLYRRWWVALITMSLGFAAGALAEAARYAPVFVAGLRAVDMQLLLLLTAGLLLSLVAAAAAPPVRRSHDQS